MLTLFLLCSNYGLTLSSLLLEDKHSQQKKLNYLLPLSRFIATIITLNKK